MLSLPLCPDVAANLLAQIVLRQLGGKGSGNFGHAGRPGERGGSGPAGDESIYYHGTSSTHAAKIEKEGLKPGSFVTTDPFWAKFYGGQDLRPGESFVLLKVRVPRDHKLTPQYDKKYFQSEAAISKEFVVRDLGGKGSGNYGHSGRPGERGGSSEGSGPTEKVRNARSLRALKAFIPIHAESQRYAEANEASVRKMVGGTRTEGNAPVDVEVIIDGRKKGIEVKTMVNNTNDKITMRKAAVEKKESWGRRNHASVHTVVLDDRGKLGHKDYSGHRLYYRRGSGSFRLGSMVKVESPAHLKELLSR